MATISTRAPEASHGFTPGAHIADPAPLGLAAFALTTFFLSFVNAGLVDEVSVLILPLVDGRSEHPSSFEVAMEKWQAPAYLKLTSVEKKDHDSVWLRYTKA